MSVPTSMATPEPVILLARDPDPCLQFAQCDGGNVQTVVWNRLDPSNDRAVRSWPPQFRDHVGVEQIHSFKLW